MGVFAKRWFLCSGVGFTATICLIYAAGVLSRSSENEDWLLRVVPKEVPMMRLGKLNIHEETITVSGFSAGASMATQLHMAHSSLFKGLAMFSQVSYRCGPDNLIWFGLRCTKYVPQWFPYPVDNAVTDAHKYEIQGLIDDMRNLKTHKVFVWIGEQDEYIPLGMAKKNKEFYSNFMPENQIEIRTDMEAKHLFPTASYGVKCNQDASATEYLGNCGYSGAFHSLQYLLGRESIKEAESLAFNKSSLKEFDQREFYPNSDLNKIAMGSFGYIYVPESCVNTTEPCHLHVNLHGCNEWPLDLALKYVEHSEFLPVAEKNRIVVLFPLTTKVPGNNNGCWDFFSYTGPHFATKNGTQIQTIYGMVQRILHGTDVSSKLIVE